jgi:toxin-antitoxin system PIN domain toxin
MIAPDVNILVYAARADSPEHAKCRDWIERIRVGSAPLILFEPVLASTLRLLTNRRIFVEPTPRSKAMAFLEALLNSPASRLMRAGDRHWTLFCKLVQQVDARGDLVQDAYLAALALEHGCEWVTADRDFARFPGLRTRYL